MQGDSTIYCFEVTNEAPHLCALSHHRSSSLHQGLSFLPKNQCAVDKVEFAKALRLTNTTIEPLSFTVPRIKVGIVNFVNSYNKYVFLYNECNNFRANSSKMIYFHRL